VIINKTNITMMRMVTVEAEKAFGAACNNKKCNDPPSGVLSNGYLLLVNISKLKKRKECIKHSPGFRIKLICH